MGGGEVSPLPFLGRRSYDYRTTTQSVLPLLRKFASLGLRVWLYRLVGWIGGLGGLGGRGLRGCGCLGGCSGDVDAVVPFVGTQPAIASLHLPLLSPRRLWYFYDQIGGVVIRYANLTHLTVRGAGHFVPGDQPERALFMFKTFLLGKKLPTNQFATDSSVYF